MDELIPFLHENRKRYAQEFAEQEAQQIKDHEKYKTELQQLKDETQRCTETIVKNLNTLTSHSLAVGKVMNDSNQSTGLPITNKSHKATIEFLTDAAELLNNGVISSMTENLRNTAPEKLHTDVQTCAQSSANLFMGMQSSLVKVETLMQNINTITSYSDDDDPDLEGSLYDQ